jgi:taurine dioxygenase
MTIEKIEVRPLSGALGAEITGVDLTRDLDNQTWSEIHRAFVQYLLLVFPGQRLKPETQLAFARRFGPIGQVPFIKTMDDHPEIIEVRKEPQNTKNFGNGWHTDFTFQEKPPLATLLHAKEISPYGGDTMFTNMYLAYDNLSAGMKAMLGDLKAIHCALRHYGPNGSSITDPDTRAMIVTGSADAAKEVERPAVRRHPDSGRKCLFVNPSYTTRFADMTEEESAPLLRYLFDHSVKAGIHLPLSLGPTYACRMGQSLYPALRGQRLRQVPSGHAARHRRRRSPGLTVQRSINPSRQISPPWNRSVASVGCPMRSGVVPRNRSASSCGTHPSVSQPVGS